MSFVNSLTYLPSMSPALLVSWELSPQPVTLHSMRTKCLPQTTFWHGTYQALSVFHCPGTSNDGDNCCSYAFLSQYWARWLSGRRKSAQGPFLDWGD